MDLNMWSQKMETTSALIPLGSAWWNGVNMLSR